MIFTSFLKNQVEQEKSHKIALLKAVLQILCVNFHFVARRVYFESRIAMSYEIEMAFGVLFWHFFPIVAYHASGFFAQKLRMTIRFAGFVACWTVIDSSLRSSE